jgi:hypothetical protein
MPLPEPTAEELAYGRFMARVHRISGSGAGEMFAAGYALGARHAPPEPAGPTDVEIRLQAVDLAVRLRSGTIRMTRKADDSGVGIIEVLADATALESYIRDGQTGALEFGPGVACSCGPDSVAHTHDAPWGCTTCGCRWYPNPDPEAVNDADRPEDAAHHFAAELVRLNTELARRGYQPSPGTPLDTAPVDTALAAVDRLTRDVNTLRLDVADLLPEDAVAPETEPVSAEDIASIARTMEGIRFTPVDIPLADGETPEQSTASRLRKALADGGADDA